MHFVSSFLFCIFACASAAPPHILFLIVDNLGWNDLGFRGAEYTTPNIDALAASGIKLESYYVQSYCSPTRSALLSSRYPYHTGLAHVVICNGLAEGLPLNNTLLPQLLKTAGYQTHAVGKWDVGSYSQSMTPTYRGFDSFYGYYGCNEDHFQHTFVGPNGAPAVCSGLDLWNDTTPDFSQSGVYSTSLFTSKITTIIDNYQPGDAPMFLYLAFQATHSPLQSPQSYIDDTDCATIPEAGRKIFCGMAKVVDEGIKNITDLLIARGLYDDTLIIFTTDNGGETQSGGNNWPLRGNKLTVWEGGVRGNAFIAGYGVPDSAKNTSTSALMHVTDWLPTIAHLANVSVSHMDIDGVDQYSALFEGGESARSEILLNLDPVATYPPNSYFMGQAAIRQNDWKLIVGMPNCSLTPWYTTPFSTYCPSGWVMVNGTMIADPPNPSFVWLFNITADPLEENNLAIVYPDIVASLRARIETYNATHVPQANPPFDMDSCPQNFNPPAWNPWLA